MYCITKKLLGVCFVGVVMGAYLLPHLYIIYILLVLRYCHVGKSTQNLIILCTFAAVGNYVVLFTERDREQKGQKRTSSILLYIYILYDNIHIVLKKKKNFVGSLA